MVDLTNPACQGLTASEQLDLRVTGLLEVEPLHYHINSYSEYINVTHGNNPSKSYCYINEGGQG